MIDKIKKQNIIFWTENVPGIDNQVKRDTAGAYNFYKKVDEVRYLQEPYLLDFFHKLLQPTLVSLEVGCGLGTDLRTFSKSGLKIVGLDYSPENAYLSNLGLQVYNLKGKTVSGDAECLPFPDNSFDLVYSWGCLHHSPNTRKCINELYRVLRHGGTAMVMLYHKGYQYYYMLLCYILGCKWIKKSLQDYISFKYDKAPLSQLFSKKQLYTFFKDFEDINIQIVTFGGIQSHPLLKYVWKLFNTFPWLMENFGSFGIIIARKQGNSPSIKNTPQPCCPICHSPLINDTNFTKCSNSVCGIQFFLYKNCIPVLHPNASEIYQYWSKSYEHEKKIL